MGEAKQRGTREERIAAAQYTFRTQVIAEEGSIEAIEDKLVNIYNMSPRGERHAEKLCKKLGTSMHQVLINHGRRVVEVKHKETE